MLSASPFIILNLDKEQLGESADQDNQKHNQCSERFYRDEIVESISSDPKSKMEEKKKMMEMLKKFEEGEGELDHDLLEKLEQDGGDDGDEEEEDELALKLKDVNIGKSACHLDVSRLKRTNGDISKEVGADKAVDEIDSNTLFTLLPPEHRTRFIESLKNADSEETKELLRLAVEEQQSEEAGPTKLPWWESPEIDLGDEEEEGDGLPYSDPPTELDADLLEGIKTPDGIGLKLIYNALAIR